MKHYYYDICEYCEFFYSCYGYDEASKIRMGETNMYLHPSTCNDYYPERKQ